MALLDTVTVDAFRFLNVRAPKPKTASQRSFVLHRGHLPFSETRFEAALKAAGSAADYRAALRSAVEGTARVAPGHVGGFFAEREEWPGVFESLSSSAPDALHERLKTLYRGLRGSVADSDFLIAPLASVWDAYLAEAVTVLLEGRPNSDALDDLASALRTGAATCAALGLATAPGGIVELLQASIFVPPDLLNASLLKESLATRAPLEDARDPGRHQQNSLVASLVSMDLAAYELSAALRAGQSTPAATGAHIATSDGAGETRGAVHAPSLLVNIRGDALSSATKQLLVRRLGARETNDWVEGVPIDRALVGLGQEIERAGEMLLGDASIGEVGQITERIPFLRSELRLTGNLTDASLDRLPILNRFRHGPASSQRLGVASSMRSLGVGDLKVVKQTLLKYEAGEVAYIENILDGQVKERTHVTRQRTEETVTVEETHSTTSEKDLQSTDRFEVADETSSAYSDRQQNEFGINVSASYGPVSVSAHTQSTTESTQLENRKRSQAFVKELVSKSVERIQQTVRQERTRKTTLEIEETNKYALTAKGKSVVGVYRWVDKVYWAQVNVYGKRLMFEFMVPEPQAVYLHTEAVKPAQSSKFTKPDPLTVTPAGITEFNYRALAAKYGAEVEAPPPHFMQTLYVATQMNDQEKAPAVELPEGYVGLYAAPAASWTYTAGNNPAITILIGTRMWKSGETWEWQSLVSQSLQKIPLQVSPLNLTSYVVTGFVQSIPSTTLLDRWKLQTYKALLAAYRLKEAEYEEYENSRAGADSGPKTKTDTESRAIERRELVRSCLEILRLQHFGSFGAIQPNPTTGWPEIDFAAAEQQGQQAAFCQQSFEWEQITYVFYPYFWGRQNEWAAKLTTPAGDSLFGKFLSAGFARVVVPVRPGHEADVLYFVETGQLWSGGDPPVLNDPTYVDIVNEIKESLDAPDGGVPDGSPPWRFVVPTSLVILDDSGRLPEWGKAKPTTGTFKPSTELCDGVPYNAAQWKDAKSVVDAIKDLGYELVKDSDAAKSLEKSQTAVKAMQSRFNQLGVAALLGHELKLTGRADACTLRALTFFDGLRLANEWPGP